MKNITVIHFRWHDFIVAGIIPVLFLVMMIIREPGLLGTMIGLCIFWYLFFLAIIYFLNRNPEAVKGIDEGSR